MVAGEGIVELLGEGEELGVGDGLLLALFNDDAGAVFDLNAEGEGETPGLAKDRLGEPVPAKLRFPLRPPLLGVGVAEAKPKLVEDEAMDGVPKGSREGVPNERDGPAEGRPNPKPMGDGRGADGKGMVGGGC